MVVDEKLSQIAAYVERGKKKERQGGEDSPDFFQVYGKNLLSNLARSMVLSVTVLPQ